MLIVPTVGVYIVNPKDLLYKKYFPALALKKFMAGLKTVYKVYNVDVDNLEKVTLQSIRPIEQEFNVIIVPSRTFIFNAFAQGDSGAIVVSLDAGNPRFSHGIYTQSLSLVRRFLGGEKVELGKGSMFYRMKPEGKAIIIASMSNITNLRLLADINNKLCKIKLDKRLKNSMIKMVAQKRKRYCLALSREKKIL